MFRATMSFTISVVTDFVKVEVYRHMRHEVRRHRHFLARLARPLHAFGGRR